MTACIVTKKNGKSIVIVLTNIPSMMMMMLIDLVYPYLPRDQNQSSLNHYVTNDIVLVAPFQYNPCNEQPTCWEPPCESSPHFPPYAPKANRKHVTFKEAL